MRVTRSSARSSPAACLLVPETVGSSSAAAILLELVHAGRAPAAIVLHEPDAILLLGLIVAKEMGWKTPIALRLDRDRYAELIGRSSDLRGRRGQCSRSHNLDAVHARRHRRHRRRSSQLSSSIGRGARMGRAGPSPGRVDRGGAADAGRETECRVAARWANACRCVELGRHDSPREQVQTSYWHYLNIPPDASGYDRDRDCPRQPGVEAGSRNDRWRDCVVDRIAYWEERLGDPKLDRADRATALKFIVHFIGDLHQPFHALGVGRGGNDVNVRVFGAGRTAATIRTRPSHATCTRCGTAG